MTDGHLHPEPEYFRQTEHPLLDDGEGAYGRTAAIAPAPPTYDRHEGKTAAEWAEVAESRCVIIQNQAETIRGYMEAVRQRDDQIDRERAATRRSDARLGSVRKELTGLRDDYAKVWRSNTLRGRRITRLLANRARLEATISRFLDAAQNHPAGSFGQRTALQAAVADYLGNKGQTVQPIGEATPGVAYEPLAAVTEAP